MKKPQSLTIISYLILAGIILAFAFIISHL